MRIGVLGPVVASDDDGAPVGLRGPLHRAVLARLVVARGRVVPLEHLIEDLWQDPPRDPRGTVRTVVAALRRALEPDRAPRAPAGLLVTEGPGYALRAAAPAVDAWRFERVLSHVTDAPGGSPVPPGTAVDLLEEALGWWRGPAFADVADAPWADPERRRLAELRLRAVERLAQARLDVGRPAEAVADLDAHAAEHPWREDAWRLLALALYRAGRQGDALAVLRRAHALRVDQLGLDPAPRLRTLETDILRRAPHLTPGDAADRVWADAAAAYERAVPAGSRVRLESTVGLLRRLAVTGGSGLEAAREHRVAAIAAAEETGDAELTARVIGLYDVPAVWSRADDAVQSAQVVAAAERALATLGERAPEALRARLLATIALESRGTRDDRGPQAAAEAERIARGLDDPEVLAFALDAAFMQSFGGAGLAPRRDAIGAELVALSARHGLESFEVLGHLVRLQARCAVGDLAGADAHADAADRLGERHERPLVRVFTGWYAALRLDLAGAATVGEVEAAYRAAARLLDGAGMPGVAQGLLPLAVLCLRVRHGLPADDDADDMEGWGPYAPWARPHVLLAAGRRDEAAAALREIPEPAHDHLLEALWCLTARAALAVGDRRVMARAHAALAPAAGEVAGAGSGLLAVGPVRAHLDELAAALGRGR